MTDFRYYNIAILKSVAKSCFYTSIQTKGRELDEKHIIHKMAKYFKKHVGFSSNTKELIANARYFDYCALCNSYGILASTTRLVSYCIDFFKDSDFYKVTKEKFKTHHDSVYRYIESTPKTYNTILYICFCVECGALFPQSLSSSIYTSSGKTTDFMIDYIIEIVSPKIKEIEELTKSQVRIETDNIYSIIIRKLEKLMLARIRCEELSNFSKKVITDFSSVTRIQ